VYCQPPRSQEEGFLNTVRYVETIRKQFAPHVKTDLDELGVILPEDGKEIAEPRSTGISQARCTPTCTLSAPAWASR